MICALDGCGAHFVPVGRQLYCCTQHKASDWHRRHTVRATTPPASDVCALHGCSNIFLRAKNRKYCCREHKALAANQALGRDRWSRVGICHCGNEFARRTERQKDCSRKCRLIRYTLESLKKPHGDSAKTEEK